MIKIRYFNFYISIFILFSCKKVDENLDLKYEVFNQLIDEELKLDKNGLENNEYLYQITIPQNITFKEKISNIINNEEIPPPPIGRISVFADSIFSQQDVEYMHAQTEINTKFTLDKNKINPHIQFIDAEQLIKIRENYISPDDYWKKFREKFGEKCTRSYSLPYFNKEKNICVISISMACGSLYGGGGTYILKKTNGKWKVYKTIESYVS